MEFQPTPDEINSGKLYAVCAYLSILILVPILAARQNRFAMYHANQGLLLLLASAAAYIVQRLPFIGFLGGILQLMLLLMLILGVINAVTGKTRPLPIIGNIQLLRF